MMCERHKPPLLICSMWQQKTLRKQTNQTPQMALICEWQTFSTLSENTNRHLGPGSRASGWRWSGMGGVAVNVCVCVCAYVGGVVEGGKRASSAECGSSRGCESAGVRRNLVLLLWRWEGWLPSPSLGCQPHVWQHHWKIDCWGPLGPITAYV